MCINQIKLQALTWSNEGIADKLGVAFLSLEAFLLELLDPFVPKALMGLANAHPQLFLSSTDEQTQEDEVDEDDDEEFITKPPNIPPHLTLSFMQRFTFPSR